MYIYPQTKIEQRIDIFVSIYAVLVNLCVNTLAVF